MENSRAELITLADKRHSPPKVSPCPRPILLILEILFILSSLFLPADNCLSHHAEPGVSFAYPRGKNMTG